MQAIKIACDTCHTIFMPDDYLWGLMQQTWLKVGESRVMIRFTVACPECFKKFPDDYPILEYQIIEPSKQN